MIMKFIIFGLFMLGAALVGLGLWKRPDDTEEDHMIALTIFSCLAIILWAIDAVIVLIRWLVS